MSGASRCRADSFSASDGLDRVRWSETSETSRPAACAHPKGVEISSSGVKGVTHTSVYLLQSTVGWDKHVFPLISHGGHPSDLFKYHNNFGLYRNKEII